MRTECCRDEKILLEALAINAEKISTIAVVGGGGKTSLIFRLMESFVSIGKKSDRDNDHTHGI